MKPIAWAVAFATRLLLARAVNTSGVDPVSGQLSRPNPAAMWPPHRPQPTPPKLRAGAYRTKLVGAKGLRP